MIAPEHDLLDRFHRVLVEEIRKRKPEYLSESFTVAEIYQDLVPYHTHRDRIGVRMNGDYEDALLRLLAGEGERWELESDAARRDFLQELQNAEPNTGIYRDFAAVNVRLNPDLVPTDSPPEEATRGSEPERPEVVLGRVEKAESEEAEAGVVESAIAEVVSENGSGTVEEVEAEVVAEVIVEDAAEVHEAAEESDVEEVDEPVTDAPRFLPDAPAPKAPAASARANGHAKADGAGPCVWCGEALPDRPDLVFCPRCGGDSRLLPCPSCGTELEAAWDYCVACGERVDS